MNKIDLYTKLYGALHNRQFVPNIFLKPFRLIVRKLAYKSLVVDKYKVNNYPERIKKDVIVSLTSFPQRLNNLWIVIESIKNQSYKPKKIILWLSSKEMNERNAEIPESLQKEIDDIFEIKYVDDILYCHLKYYYAFKEYPHHTIITLDDDIIYHPDTIKTLFDTSEKYPHAIISNFVRQISFNGKHLSPYNDWKTIQDNKIDLNPNLLLLGYSGVLYKPHLFNPLLYDKSVFQKLCPKADDLWLSANAKFSNIPIIKSNFNKPLIFIDQDTPKLSSANVNQNQNDIQINNILNFFKKDFNINLFTPKEVKD